VFLTYFHQDCPACGKILRIPVEQYGEEITCTTCGTAFSATDPEGADGASCFEGHAAENVANQSLGQTLPEYRLMVVAQDREYLDVLTRMFIRRGLTVTAVHHPRQALEAASMHNFQVAVLECDLPEVDGIELMGRLKSLIQNLQVIILAERSRRGVKEKALKEGAFGYMCQPYQMSDLEDMIDNAFERKFCSPETILYGGISSHEGITNQSIARPS